jgi:hypothetical protein
MKFWKKVVLILFFVFVLAQIPFIYNRYKIGNLSDKIAAMQTTRTVKPSGYNDYKGIVHAHTSIGGHSTGTFDELISASNENELDFVVMTEHTSALYDTSAMTLRGVHGKTLFVSGNEVSTIDDDRFLVITGDAEIYKGNTTKTADFIEQIHAKNKLAFVTYPEKLQSKTANFDGIEIFSLNTNSKNMNAALFLFDALWSYNSYPELLISKYFTRQNDNLAFYDEQTKSRELTLFAGSDAHSNIGFHLFGDDANHKIVNLKFDDYATIFRVMRTHVLLAKDKPLTQENLLAALKNGNCYAGFDAMSDTTGFSFTANDKIQGDEVSMQNSVNLKADAPQSAKFVLYRNGGKVYEQTNTNEMNFEAKESGTYRVEVYLESLESPFNSIPWILSNPIYIR